MKSADILWTQGKHDECYTPAYGVKALLPHLPHGRRYWCPFDTEESEFVIQLRTAGHSVVYSHISHGLDYYTHEPSHWDIMVSNPPFTRKADIFARALALGKPFALLMSLTWLNDAAPKRLFRDRQLQLLMFEERMQFLGQGAKITFSSAYFCCDLLRQQLCFDRLKNYGMK